MKRFIKGLLKVNLTKGLIFGFFLSFLLLSKFYFIENLGFMKIGFLRGYFFEELNTIKEPKSLNISNCVFCHIAVGDAIMRLKLLGVLLFARIVLLTSSPENEPDHLNGYEAYFKTIYVNTWNHLMSAEKDNNPDQPKKIWTLLDYPFTYGDHNAANSKYQGR